MADNKDIMKTLIAKAIEKIIDECIQEDILKAIDDPDYLAKLFKEYKDYKKENP